MVAHLPQHGTCTSSFLQPQALILSFLSKNFCWHQRSFYCKTCKLCLPERDRHLQCLVELHTAAWPGSSCQAPRADGQEGAYSKGDNDSISPDLAAEWKPIYSSNPKRHTSIKEIYTRVGLPRPSSPPGPSKLNASKMCPHSPGLPSLSAPQGCLRQAWVPPHRPSGTARN